ncbi:uncharacterized protein EI90DRAFT_3000848 [Cantharellus anzutake]|uniref:uncharacterized protein n=1 Tax=Cantharellus anzutake TaxID=1750568 RepID=UPI00190478A6|nr:uncharacterized protein EI90DRAFT_3000848 [Cantharellus anzutake]KAF8324164.1 hypothetical protein EI90DRAFT_3000848 [Cantharellus anzutake]
MAEAIEPLKRWGRVTSSLPKRHALVVLVLAWVFFLQLSGLSLFTRGFLLTRLALETKSSCEPTKECSLGATHKRALFLIIDALRFDFISPNPPLPTSRYSHNVLTLPRELTEAYPTHSFIFNAFADPPTATPQRIKALMTGSLPTFVDIGSSFSASAIEEDNLIFQMRAANRNVAFAGDDTWMHTFANSFAQNMTFPYDSFNVEDLHSVDEGVIRHLFPLLAAGENWGLMIGHFLGVDHVGHRLGPDHPAMRSKLEQMDDVLRRVVNEMDDDTLLVVLGDHGMDAKGDHGGDGDLETSAAMWVYSKSVPLSDGSANVPSLMRSTRTFPRSSAPHRSIQQIDILPSIAFLLGLPIPFNNLGSIIPEFFMRSTTSSYFSTPTYILDDVMRLNAKQVLSYLRAYATSPSGGELQDTIAALETAYSEAESLSGRDATLAFFSFTRQALTHCRSLWAQFNSVLMMTGLVILVGCLPVLAVLYYSLANCRDSWEEVGQGVIILGWGSAVIGALVGVLATSLRARYALSWYKLSAMDIILASSTVTSQFAMLVVNLPSILPNARRHLWTASKSKTIFPVIVTLLHSISFTSNSFILWEDKMTLFLLASLVLPSVVAAFSVPLITLRRRILFLSAVLTALFRLSSFSTVCREEQHPYCHVTFYSSSTRPLSPTLVVLLSLPIAYYLPYLILQRFLAPSKSDKGAAPFIVGTLWKYCLLGATIYWLMEWSESFFADALSFGWLQLSLSVRTVIARTVLGGTLFGGYAYWWSAPLNVELREEDANGTDAMSSGREGKQIVILGWANMYGSMYLMFILPLFGLLWLVTQLTGQVVLSLGLASIMCFVELVDAERDARTLRTSVERVSGDGNSSFASDATNGGSSPVMSSSDPARSPTLAEPVILSLLAHLIFFGTGHQATFSSIQWKTAFVGFPTLTYPFSPALVSLNTFGPFLLAPLAAPLLATWAISPPQKGRVLVLSDSLRISVGVIIYFTSVLIGTATSAAILRRHLMVWKVFAPRFMLAGVVTVVVDIGVALALLVGGKRGVDKVREIFTTDA